MDGTRVADLDEVAADDTFLFRVRSVDGAAVASGEAALQSDEDAAEHSSTSPRSQAHEDSAERSSASSRTQPDDAVEHSSTSPDSQARQDAAEGFADASGDDDAEDDDGIAMPDDMRSADDDVREAILLRSGSDGEGVVCWLNYCQHMTHIKLDKGTGAPVRDGEVVCANHGALFAADSGECTYGPCEGAFLTEVEVSVADGGVYLVDSDYEYVGEGPVETDDDLSSSSNVIL